MSTARIKAAESELSSAQKKYQACAAKVKDFERRIEAGVPIAERKAVSDQYWAALTAQDEAMKKLDVASRSVQRRRREIEDPS